MHQIMFPLMIVNVLENHATPEHPLTISEITKLVNQEFAPFSDQEQVMNRSTVMRTLESLAFYTEVGNLLNFRVIEGGTERKKRYHVVGIEERAMTRTRAVIRDQAVTRERAVTRKQTGAVRISAAAR